MISELVKELITTEYPHLRGALAVRFTTRDLLYEVSKGSAGLLIELGPDTLRHKDRLAIISRCARAAQEIHAGITSASVITGVNEVNS